VREVPHNLVRPAAPVSEKRFQAKVIQLAKLQGWAVYHTYDSRRSSPGLPDLILVRERVLWRELKTDVGRLTTDQLAWIARLKDGQADVDVWRPKHFDRIVDELSRKLVCSS
jgi:hypothetical protein